MDLISRDKAQEIIPKVVLGVSDFAECIRDSVDTVFDNCPSAFEGMTNGEVIQALFDGLIMHDNPAMRKYTIPITYEFWNAPYKGVSE